MSVTQWIELIAALTIPVALIAIVVERLISKKGIGVRTIQFAGVATFTPIILVLALERIIDGHAVSALIGAFAGYLFSNIAEFDRRSADPKRDA